MRLIPPSRSAALGRVSRSKRASRQQKRLLGVLVLAGGVGLFFWGLAVFPPPCPPHEFICPPNYGHEVWAGALLLAALMTVVQGVVLVIWGRPSRRGRPGRRW